MEKQESRKKTALHSSQSTNAEDIEKKVDQLLNARTQIPDKQKPQNNQSENWSVPDNNEKARLFYVESKKNSESSKEMDKEKKSTSMKTKKHIGFKKKKKENSTVKTKPSLTKKSPQNPDDLPHFEESIAQVKTEEAAWLDQQIKAKLNIDKDTKPDSPTPSKVDIVQSDQETHIEKPFVKTDKTPDSEPQEMTPVPETETTSFESTIDQSAVLTKSVDEKPNQEGNQKEIKIDEITPDGQIRFLKEANQLKTYTLQRMGFGENTIEEIDFYPIHEPFAYVEIIREKESLDKRYVLLEMQLSKDEEYLLKFIKETLDGFIFKTSDLESKGEDKYLS